MNNTSITTQENTTTNRPVRYFISFRSIHEANVWFSRQTCIVVTKMAMSTNTSFSFPANDITVTEIRIEYLKYPYPTNNRYGIDELSFTRMYVSSNVEKKVEKWHEENPHKTCVQCLKSSSKRYIAGTSIGFFAFIKDKLVILYKV